MQGTIISDKEREGRRGKAILRKITAVLLELGIEEVDFRTSDPVGRDTSIRGNGILQAQRCEMQCCTGEYKKPCEWSKE